MRHLIDIPEFSVEELDQLMDTASDIIAHPTKYADVKIYQKGGGYQ